MLNISKMIEVSKLEDTVKTDVYINYLNNNFDLNNLIDVFNYWKVRNMGSYNKFININDNDIILEIFGTYYIILNKNNKIQIPLPKTIGEFITDMFRFNIKLFWNDNIMNILEPKDYYHKDKIKNYYINLLTKMNK